MKRKNNTKKTEYLKTFVVILKISSIKKGKKGKEDRVDITFFKDLFTLLCVWVFFSACIYVRRVCVPDTGQGQKRAADVLALELQL